MTNLDRNISSRFQRIVQDYPNHTALLGDGWQATYRELDNVANCLSHTILSRDGNFGDRVAIMMNHAAELVAALVGVFKAGRILVVLNPADPIDRMKSMLSDAQPSLIITDPAHAKKAKEISRAIPTFVFRPKLFQGQAPASLDCNVGLDDIASLVYTSGTTGKPKGVMKTHGQILANLSRLQVALHVTPTDRVALLASVSGGHGQAMTLIAILNGSTLCPFPVMERGVTQLAEWLHRHRITVYASSSSLFRAFTRTLGNERLKQIRVVRLASDPATPDDLRAFQKHFSSQCSLVHTLSSSETGTLAYWRFDGQIVDTDRLPVGFPYDGIKVALVDESGHPVPDGQTGEIVIQSRYQAAGYWRLPELTAKHFRFADDGSGDRVFFSGDRAKRLPDGMLYFQGRSDGRLKIRGYRIEPDDIENALRELSEVEQATICDAPGPAGNPMLVAFVVPRCGFHCDSESLRTKLRASLADHMIPALILPLREIPLSPNGKIDRQLLRSCVQIEAPSRTGKPPKTETEKRLADFWKQTFRQQEIFRDDHFFELGGDSLIAAVIAAHIYAEWNVEISMRTFVDRPRLRKLAQTIDRARKHKSVSVEMPIEKVPRNQPIPLSFVQENIWKECRSPEKMRGWTVASRQRVRGPLNYEVLRECMQKLLDRHEILRTTIEEKKGAPCAVIHDQVKMVLQIVDFSTHSNPTEDAIDYCREQARNSLPDLGQLPLVRFWLIRTGEEEHHLLRINHHIISDNWSWNIYYNELALLYEACLAGEQAVLPAAPQYADYAAWRRRTMKADSVSFLECIDWWKRIFTPAPPRLLLPFERATPVANALPSDGVISWQIPMETSRRLDSIAVHNNTTYLAIRLAVFLATIAEATGQSDLVVGCLSTGRTRLEWQNMFGMFANTIAVRTQWNPKRRFVRWLRVVSNAITSAQEHSEIPYHLLCQRIAAEGGAIPDINVQFSISDLNVSRRFGNLELTSTQHEIENISWGFCMKLGQNPESGCYTSFDARLHDPHRVRQFLDRYLQLLDVFSESPKSRMSQCMQSVVPRRLPFTDRRSTTQHRDAA